MPEFFINALKPVGAFLLSLWLIWLPFFALALFFTAWLRYIRLKYWQGLQWVLLEIKPPREILFTPKGAENIFAGLWATYGTIVTKVDKYIRGVIQDYFSLEIAGLGGEIHFYIRTRIQFRNLVEAQVYSQYPEAEVTEAQDYTEFVPQNIPNKDWDMWGATLKLIAPDVYPIKTYRSFIDVIPQKEGGFIDPLASLMEVLGKLQPSEQFWIQILIRPVSDDWRKKGTQLVANLMGKAKKKKQSLLAKEVSGWAQSAASVTREFITGKPEELATEKEKERPQPLSLMMYLSPGEQEIIKAIEENISKKGFETKINLAYLGKVDIFSKANVGAVIGVFNQFAGLNLNGFRPDKRTKVAGEYLFVKARRTFRKRRMFKFCRTRSFWKKGFVLNTEELATIFHFPATIVEAPATPRIEAKRGGAPPGLPV